MLPLRPGEGVRLVILGSPRTKKNHQRIIRVKGRPVIMQAKTSEGWETLAIIQLMAQRDRLGFPAGRGMPVSLRALVYRERNVGDLGNYLAAICDALERAGVVENDRLIQSFDGSRLLLDKARPRVELEITAMDATPATPGRAGG